MWREWAPQIRTNLMRDFGLSRAQAASILRDLGHESNGFSQMQEGRPRRGRGSYGIALWTGPGRREFERFAAADGMAASSLVANYAFLRPELGGKYHALASVRRQTTANGAMMALERLFERAGLKPYRNRAAWRSGRWRCAPEVGRSTPGNRMSWAGRAGLGNFQAAAVWRARQFRNRSRRRGGTRRMAGGTVTRRSTSLAQQTRSHVARTIRNEVKFMFRGSHSDLGLPRLNGA